jgi:AraC-like DNA-binding protein
LAALSGTSCGPSTSPANSRRPIFRPLTVAGDRWGTGRARGLDFADVLVDGVDDHVLRDLVIPRAFTTRFALALAVPPESLHVNTALRLESWRVLVEHAGRPIHTNAVAEALGVTREHLSRAFGAAGAPNLKRVIDLVRLAAAAELSKNPGYVVGDVARVHGFASSSHLSTSSQRIVGIRPSSLARLRTVDLIERASCMGGCGAGRWCRGRRVAAGGNRRSPAGAIALRDPTGPGEPENWKEGGTARREEDLSCSLECRVAL